MRQVDAARHLIHLGADVHAKDDQGNAPLHKAAWGFLPDRLTPDDKVERPKLTDKIRAQNEMIAVVLQAAGGGESGGLIDKPNLLGEPPRQLREKRQAERREQKKARRRPPPTRGRGRGRGRGQL